LHPVGDGKGLQDRKIWGKNKQEITVTSGEEVVQSNFEHKREQDVGWAGTAGLKEKQRSLFEHRGSGK